jgi:hypothetical protein
MPAPKAWDPWFNLAEIPPVQAEPYVDYTATPEKSPVSRVLSFLPFVLGGVFLFFLLRSK